MKISFFIFFIIVVSKVYSDNNCKLRMSNSKMSIFRDSGKLIYNEGVINSDWQGEVGTPYVVNSDEDIQYFYIMENKLADNSNKDKIVNINNIEYIY